MFVPTEYKELPGWFLISGVDGYLASKAGAIKKLSNGYETFGGNAGHYLKCYIHRKPTYVHRLICTAFHGPPENTHHEVNHKDGNKFNNCWENLEWASKSENATHAYASGLNNGGKLRRPIVVRDTINQLEAEFDSIGSLLGVIPTATRTGVGHAIREQRLYLDRYLIKDAASEVDWSNFKGAGRSPGEIYLITDRYSGKKFIFNNMDMAAYFLGDSVYSDQDKYMVDIVR